MAHNDKPGAELGPLRRGKTIRRKIQGIDFEMRLDASVFGILDSLLERKGRSFIAKAAIVCIRQSRRACLTRIRIETDGRRGGVESSQKCSRFPCRRHVERLVAGSNPAAGCFQVFYGFYGFGFYGSLSSRANAKAYIRS